MTQSTFVRSFRLWRQDETMHFSSQLFLLSSAIFFIWQQGIESRHVHSHHDRDTTDSLAQGRERRGVEGRSVEEPRAGQGAGVWTWRGDRRPPTGILLHQTDSGQHLTGKDKEEEEEKEEDVGHYKVADDYAAVHPDRRSDRAKASPTTDVIHATDTNNKGSSLPTDLKYHKTVHTEQTPNPRPSSSQTLPDTVPQRLNTAVHAHRNRRGNSQNSHLSRAQRQQDETRPRVQEGEETNAPVKTDDSDQDSTIAGTAAVDRDDDNDSNQKVVSPQNGDANQDRNSTISVEKMPGKGVSEEELLYTTFPRTKAEDRPFNKSALDPIKDEDKKALLTELLNEWTALKALLGMRLKRESGGDEEDEDDSSSSDSDDSGEDTQLSASGIAEEEEKADAELARMIEQDVPILTPKEGVKTLSKDEQRDIDEMAYMLTDLELSTSGKDDGVSKSDPSKMSTKLDPHLEEEKEFEQNKSSRKRRNSSARKSRGTLTRKTATEMTDENDVVSAGMTVGTVGGNLAENREKRNTAFVQEDSMRKDAPSDNRVPRHVRHNRHSVSPGHIHDVSGDHSMVSDRKRFTAQSSEDRKNRSPRDDGGWSKERLPANEVSEGVHVIKRHSAKRDTAGKNHEAKSIVDDRDVEQSSSFDDLQAFKSFPLTIIVHDKDHVEVALPMERKGKRINSKEKNIQSSVMDILRAIKKSNRKRNTLTKAASAKQLNWGNSPDLVNAAHTFTVKQEKNKNNRGFNKKVTSKDTTSLTSSQGKTTNDQIHTQMLTSQTFIIDGKGKNRAKVISLASHVNASSADNTEGNSRNHKRDVRHASKAGLIQSLRIKHSAVHQAKEVRIRESKQNRNEENTKTLSGQPVSELHAAMNNTGTIMAKKQESPETENRSGMTNGNGETGIQLSKAGRELDSLIRPQVVPVFVDEASHTNQDIAGTPPLNTESVSENEHLQTFGSTGNDNTNNSMAKNKSKLSEIKTNATILHTHTHPPDQMMSDNGEFSMNVQNALVKQNRNKPKHMKETSEMEQDTMTDQGNMILRTKEDTTNQTDRIIINQSKYTQQLPSRSQNPHGVDVFDQFKQEAKSNEAIPMKKEKSSSNEQDADKTTEAKHNAETEIHTVGIYSGKDRHHMLKRNAKKKKKKGKKDKGGLDDDMLNPEKDSDSAEEELQGSPKDKDETKDKKGKGKSDDEQSKSGDKDPDLLNKIYEHVLNIEKMVSGNGISPLGGDSNLGSKTKEIMKIQAQSIVESEPKFNNSNEPEKGKKSDKKGPKQNKKNKGKKKGKGSDDLQDELPDMDQDSKGGDKTKGDDKTDGDKKSGSDPLGDMDGVEYKKKKKKDKKSKSGKKGKDPGGGLDGGGDSDLDGMEGEQPKEDEDSPTKKEKGDKKKSALGDDDEEADPMKAKKGKGGAKDKKKGKGKSGFDDAFGAEDKSDQSQGEDSEENEAKPGKGSDKNKQKDFMGDDMEDGLGGKEKDNKKNKKKGDTKKQGAGGKKDDKSKKNNMEETVVFEKIPHGSKKVTRKIVEEDIILEDDKEPRKEDKNVPNKAKKSGGKEASEQSEEDMDL